MTWMSIISLIITIPPRPTHPKPQQSVISLRLGQSHLDTFRPFIY